MNLEVSKFRLPYVDVKVAKCKGSLSIHDSSHKAGVRNFSTEVDIKVTFDLLRFYEKRF
ncbi:MAG: hypothetical protein NZ895_01330 [Archaeoglobaceae archaeon]|nr:hypothetical protein [Archaeoglobaceae archaeon]MCX8151675.1 hypothetical protein [Archaeoglobaceae archaeon]MDW8013047.1 hypothetical protein [Archaeoglobaceae archaeon]